MRKWLKDKRETLGLTHEEVANKAGIARSYYTNIENGIKTPSVEVAKAIAKAVKEKWELFFEIECSSKEHSIVSKIS